MENRISPSRREGCGEEGRVGGKKKRKAARALSSDSSSSSSSSSSASSDNHKRRRTKKHKKRDYSKLDQLIAKISDLENKLGQVPRGSMAVGEDCSSCDVDPNISGDLYDDEPVRMQTPEATDLPSTATDDPQFDFSVGTKLKEPSVPQTSSEFLEHLKSLQHFGQMDWKSVRYVEVQKQYVHSPGFTSLEPNSEITNYDNSKFTAHMETAFSSLTFALLKQSEAIRNNVREFLNWAQHKEQLNYENIFRKWNDVFSNGEYPKITADLFQLTCGHRAELVQNRRDAILSSVKDPIHREALKKIPPSCATLFADEQFTAVLDKAGGVKNVFWPKYKGRMTSAPHNNPGPSVKQPTSYRHNPKPFQRNKNEGRNNNQHKSGPSYQSYRGRGGSRYHTGRSANEPYKGRKTGSPSSHRERRSQHTRKY